ncbi:MAG: hypothetical protein GF344_18235 [Chitinivibrionales bacterium]|nr:hypothetical protein [Chitinivibrionales bacterium]MBD3358597.1 hypothetical protein [Chitinivibrionales bacterium]
METGPKIEHTITTIWFTLVMAASCTTADDALRMSFLPLETGFQLLAGLNLAMGAFADQDQPIKSTNDGFAGPGPAIGARGHLTFGSSGLDIVLDLSVLTATINKPGIEHAIREEYAFAGNMNVDTKARMWWVGIPLTIGPRLGIEVRPGFAFYGVGLFGVAFIKMPDISFESPIVAGTYEHTPTVGACVAGELGVTFTHLVCGARIFAAPSLEIDSHETLSHAGVDTSDRYTRANAVQSVILFIGYRF